VTVEVTFSVFLLLTVVLLVGVVVTGLRARRRIHLTLVATTFASLATTIVLALRLGELYDLEAAGTITPVHLTLARINAFAFLLPVATGFWTLRRAERRPLHRKAAFLVLALTVASAATGTWMMLSAPPLESSSIHERQLVLPDDQARRGE